jgi:serine phosphatase RsbU (regulator of sigma subunit)
MAGSGGARGSLPWVGFGLFLALTLGTWGLYGVNFARWPDSPDFGWRTMYNSGANVVAQVFDAAAAAGLRTGDKILAINGRPYSTFDELFFGKIRRDEPGAVNTYTVARDGGTVDIEVPTGRVGLGSVLARSGPLFVVGLVYILIGALVFLMKPRAPESRLFFQMTCFLGIGIGLSSPADLIVPAWLYDVRFLANQLVPAAMIHLALRFPKPRAFATARPWIAALPYLPALGIFVLRQMTATAQWNIPRFVFLLWISYTVVGILFFLASTGWNVLRDASVITRLQSRVILVGTVLGFFIPSLDLLSGLLWQAAIFPDPILGFGACFSLFPLSIGYTIVKHDLFAIDVIVRRTYGYVLTTGSVVATYAGMVAIANVVFRAGDAARSPAFSIGFALVVVFLVQPLHRRVQSFVDRTFYRQQYDYRLAIRSLSEAMTSILDPELIPKTLVGAVVREMVLENGILLLPRAPGDGYEVAVVEGAAPGIRPGADVPAADPLLRLVAEQKRHVLRHDVALNPAYETARADLERTLDVLAADLLLPMTYKDQLRGILALGRKKSGKLFTPEDFDLLRTMLNQSAIALENAHLFRENLQKGRMEEELKIAHDIQMGMLPEEAPRVAGLTIAARTIPAREVGGDFYDFVEFSADGAGTRLGLIIADVSGKGVSAGLLMAGARSTYRVLLESNASVRDIMMIANQRLHQDIRKGMFVALLYAVFEPGGRILTLSNAGQTQPVLCGPDIDPVYITTEGDTFPLGIIPDCDYQETKVSLAGGHVVVFYTDGAVEAMDAAGEVYGFERFLDSIRAGRDLEAPALLDKLFADIAQFVGETEQHDDTTIIVARVE